MIQDFLPPLSELDEETRTKVAALLTDRNELLEAKVKLNRLRAAMLLNPTQSNIDSVEAYTSTVIAPLNTRLNEQAGELMMASVDVEGLKSMMPMVLMGLLRSVNLSLLLTAIDIEPDRIDRLISKIKDYVHSKD